MKKQTKIILCIGAALAAVGLLVYSNKKNFANASGGNFLNATGSKLVLGETKNLTEETGDCADCSFTITVSGEILSTGENEIIERGVCWATNANPTIANNKVIDNSGQDNFSCEIPNLSSNVMYYIKSYAKDSKQVVAYGTRIAYKKTIGVPVVSTLPSNKLVDKAITLDNEFDNSPEYKYSHYDKSYSLTTGVRVTSAGSCSLSNVGVIYSLTPFPSLVDLQGDNPPKVKYLTDYTPLPPKPIVVKPVVTPPTPPSVSGCFYCEELKNTLASTQTVSYTDCYGVKNSKSLAPGSSIMIKSGTLTKGNLTVLRSGTSYTVCDGVPVPVNPVNVDTSYSCTDAKRMLEEHISIMARSRYSGQSLLDAQQKLADLQFAVTKACGEVTPTPTTTRLSIEGVLSGNYGGQIIVKRNDTNILDNPIIFDLKTNGINQVINKEVSAGSYTITAKSLVDSGNVEIVVVGYTKNSSTPISLFKGKAMVKDSSVGTFPFNISNTEYTTINITLSVNSEVLPAPITPAPITPAPVVSLPAKPISSVPADIFSQLLSILDTLKCMKEYNEIKSFLLDTNNMPYIIMAYQKMGKYPAKNRPSERPCWLCSWIDYCDSKEMLDFYNFAKLSKTPPQDCFDCQKWSNLTGNTISGVSFVDCNGNIVSNKSIAADATIEIKSGTLYYSKNKISSLEFIGSNFKNAAADSRILPISTISTPMFVPTPELTLTSSRKVCVDSRAFDGGFVNSNSNSNFLNFDGFANSMNNNNFLNINGQGFLNATGQPDGTGDYSTELILPLNTTVYIRGFATNQYGTSYGSQVVFRVNAMKKK